MSGAASSANSSSGADRVASVPSPAKGGEPSAYAKRLPQVKKTGNFLQDSEAEARRYATMQCIDILNRDPSHAHPTLNFLQRRISEGARAAAVSVDEEFQSVSTLQRLGKGWVLNFLVRISDIPLHALVKAVAFDADAGVQLLMFALVYGSNLKIPPEGAVKEVLWRAFLARDAVVGHRLRSWSEKGGVGKDFRLNWKKGVYKLVWCEEEKQLRRIEHVSGDTVEVKDLVVTPFWTLLENWSDYTASLQLKPHAPMKLYKFFEGAKTGPFRIAPCTGVSKAFDGEVSVIFQDFQKAKEETVGKTTAAATATAALAVVETGKRAAALDKARAAAKTAIASKRAKRTLTLEKSLT